MTPRARATTTPLRLTPADRVTLLRAGLGLVVFVLVILTVVGILPQRSWLLFGVLVPTLILDGVDGAVARSTGTVTARGARWDTEADAAIVLVASLAVAPLAPWALAIGLARYLFGLVNLLWPPRRRDLPFSQGRRVIGGCQGAALATALAPVVPVWLAQLVTLVALTLLVFSFGRDIVHQRRR